jgi:hypothetical protein
VSPAVVTLVAFVRHSVWTWQRIADELGYRPKGHAAQAVQRYLAARLIRRSARCTAAPWSGAVAGSPAMPKLPLCDFVQSIAPGPERCSLVVGAQFLGQNLEL